MKCIICGNNKTSVIDSRIKEDYVHRRRECPCCGTRFSSTEYSNRSIQELQEDYRKLEEDNRKLEAWKRTVEERTYGNTIRTIPQRKVVHKIRPGSRSKVG